MVTISETHNAISSNLKLKKSIDRNSGFWSRFYHKVNFPSLEFSIPICTMKKITLGQWFSGVLGFCEGLGVEVCR